MDPEIFKVLAQSGIAGLALGALALLAWKIGQRMIRAQDQVGKKLDDHTAADQAAWSRVDVKIESHFLLVSQAIATSRQQFSEELASGNQQVADDLADFRRELALGLATLRQDVAVIGTRVDTVLDLDSRPRPIVDDEHYSRRTSIPLDRHDQVPRSGMPVADRGPRKRKDDDR